MAKKATTKKAGKTKAVKNTAARVVAKQAVKQQDTRPVNAETRADAAAPAERKQRAKSPKQRDPRLPAPGTVLTGRHKGKEHSCKVLDKGFEYRGKPYRSLSAIAREITGCSWNGFAFFHCLATKEA